MPKTKTGFRSFFSNWRFHACKSRREKSADGQAMHDKDLPGWRGWLHGRAWLDKITSSGLEKGIRAEWVFGQRGGPAVELHLGPGIMADSCPASVTAHIKVPLLASLFLTVENIIPSAILPGDRIIPGTGRVPPWSSDGELIYDWTPGRSVGFTMHDGTLWLSFWERDDGVWDSKDPWWAKVQSIDPIAILFGHESIQYRKKSLREVDIPMPEGTYKAKASVTYYTNRRWHFVKRWWKISFDDIRGPGGVTCIPCPGKGENSWDCGMGGTQSASVPMGLELPEAIGHLVGSELRMRLKRTGNPLWKPNSEDIAQLTTKPN